MKFDAEKVAQLAKIDLKAGEKEKLQKELSSILGYVNKLQNLSTDSVLPTSHVLDLENVFRADEVIPSKAAEEALRHAPARDENFFKVPKVVDK